MNLLRFGLAFAFCVGFAGVSFSQDTEKPEPAVQAAATPESDQPDSDVSKSESSDDVPAVLNPENDTSYWLLGEFIGEVKESGDDPERKGMRMGLQLRPVGSTDFDAQMFEGGLPGEGESFADEPTQDPIGSPRDPMRLVGRRSGKLLVLSGGPFAIFVDAAGCTLIDPAGKTLGRLDRVSRASASLGAKPPAGAITLFGDDGDTSMLVDATVASDGTLKQGFAIKPMVQDFDLHAEFRTPYMPNKDDQQRGNSGIYIHGRYEMQILDSFAQSPAFNHLGAIYKAKAPDINMALPPLSWQTYDVRFTAARYNADGSKYIDARVTSWVNGVMVQNDVALAGPTGHGKDEQPLLLPIQLQDHNDEVRFRNLWIIDRGLVEADFPVEGNAKQPPLLMPSDEKESDQVDTADTLPLSTPIVSQDSQELPAPVVN
ncbi:hypothetical protein LF1_02540 [Rubripirellula obstinata]|uniref:3-keto-alpha-glucoside-1,2-lyase/3-keto-2-hydroxy-glucal hydratase domain-containing protein n=1 Tax=Rubripirellula obstinata TaxID=406547 RepID=A0A5B1CEJ7_9BACT|nr:DUF1080 domain-containing protein [Rubripirellula obstinata]KAA1257764.1 hypothetical protein LF1_02540 [Rubripirellula obstinata]